MFGIEEHNDYINGVDDHFERYAGEGENPYMAGYDEVPDGYYVCMKTGKLVKDEVASENDPALIAYEQWCEQNEYPTHW